VWSRDDDPTLMDNIFFIGNSTDLTQDFSKRDENPTIRI